MNAVPNNGRLLEVDVSQQQLRAYIKNELQHNALLLPGHRVMIVLGRVRPDQVINKRDSYVNAFIIQSRGVECAIPCDACARKMMVDGDQFAYPFPTCVRLSGHFGGCCGNCKWPDHAARCTNRDGGAIRGVRGGSLGTGGSNSPNTRGSNPSSTRGTPIRLSRRLGAGPGAAATGSPGAGTSASTPINLDSSSSDEVGEVPYEIVDDDEEEDDEDGDDDAYDDAPAGSSSAIPISLDDDEDEGTAVVLASGVGNTGTSDRFGREFSLD